MKKFVYLALVTALLLSLLGGSPAMAAGPNGPAGKSNTGQLNLYEKDANWDIVAKGASGKLTYNLSGPTFIFSFNGHKLEPLTGYSLIYYPDPWPGNSPGALISIGTSDGSGNLVMAGSVDLNMDLPSKPDKNFPGAKIWLVLSKDYDSTAKQMSAWHPTEYLFEGATEGIYYNDTNKTRTVTFNLGTHGTLGSGTLVQTINYGANAVAPTVTPNAGWNFTGWDKAFTNVQSVLTVNAVYSQVNYQVTFDLGTHGTLGSGTLVQTVTNQSII